MERIENELGPYKYHKGRTDPEELGFRIRNLKECIEFFNDDHMTSGQLKEQLKRYDINSVCLKQMNQLKEFINTSRMSYQSVYAPATEQLVNLIRENKYATH